MAHRVEESIPYGVLQLIRVHVPAAARGIVKDFGYREVAFGLGHAAVTNPERAARRNGANLLVGRERLRHTAAEIESGDAGGLGHSRYTAACQQSLHLRGGPHGLAIVGI